MMMMMIRRPTGGVWGYLSHHNHHPQPSPANTSCDHYLRPLPATYHLAHDADYFIQQGRAHNITDHECALLQTYAAD